MLIDLMQAILVENIKKVIAILSTCPELLSMRPKGSERTVLAIAVREKYENTELIECLLLYEKAPSVNINNEDNNNDNCKIDFKLLEESIVNPVDHCPSNYELAPQQQVLTTKMLMLNKLINKLEYAYKLKNEEFTDTLKQLHIIKFKASKNPSQVMQKLEEKIKELELLHNHQNNNVHNSDKVQICKLNNNNNINDNTNNNTLNDNHISYKHLDINEINRPCSNNNNEQCNESTQQNDNIVQLPTSGNNPNHTTQVIGDLAENI